MMLSIQLQPASKLRYKYKTVPFSHQKKALNKILTLDGRAALFMEMGTGKTKVAIDWAGIRYFNEDFRRVLVVAPLSVLGVWPGQLKLHSAAPFKVTTLTGATNERVRMMKLLLLEKQRGHEHLRYVIINYEGIWREADNGSSMTNLLSAWAPDLVIFDESHRLKNPTAKQSRAGFKISQSSRDRLILTGTPITKAPLDSYGQFRCIEPKIFHETWRAFKDYYGVWGGFSGYQLRGYRHLDELIGKVRGWSYRIKKEQCLDLPPKLFLDVPVTLSDQTKKLYRKMAMDMIIEIEDTHATAAIVLTKLLRLSQITSGFVKDIEGKIRILDDGKLNTCMDLVKDLVEEEEKVVIFTRFRTDIARLTDRLTKAHIQYRILDGTVPSSKRDSFVREFHANPNIKVFVTQIQAGSLGIDLTPASAAIFYSLDYSAANYWQAQDRLHRIGQSRKVTYFHLVAPRTIDQVVLGVLKDKGKIAEAVLHNPKVLLG